jgi:hypothetical protein
LLTETFALESQLLDLQNQAEIKQAEERKARNEEYFNQFSEVLTAVTDIALQAQEAQIANLDTLIADSQTKVDILNQALAETSAQRSALDAQIAKSEEDARNARNTNAKEIKEQLDAQRKQRVALIKAEKAQQKQAEEAAAETARLEEEKAKQEKKLARQQAQIAIVSAVVESAPALVKSLSLPFPASLASFATISALIGTVVANAKTATQKLRKGGLLVGASHENGGIRGTGSFGNIEVEGGEMVINKKATERNLPLLQRINDFGAVKKFQDGGVLTPNAEATSVATGSGEVTEIARAVSDLAKRPAVVGVTDITDGINRVNTIDDSSQIG